MTALFHDVRWWLYGLVCTLGWVVCPEPERTAIGVIYDEGARKVTKVRGAKEADALRARSRVSTGEHSDYD